MIVGSGVKPKMNLPLALILAFRRCLRELALIALLPGLTWPRALVIPGDGVVLDGLLVSPLAEDVLCLRL